MTSNKQTIHSLETQIVALQNELAMLTVGTGVIPLTKGKVTVVDAEDYPFLACFKWQYMTHGYAARVDTGSGSRVMVWMHREVAERMGLDIEGIEVDHKDHNTLNNRRANIRAATRSNDTCNSVRRFDNSSGIKGVDFHKASGKWRARIAVNGVPHNLGVFETKEAAGEAYAQKAHFLHKEFACLGDLNG